MLLLSVALLSVVFYNDYAVQYRSELKSEALSMAHAINGGLAEEDYLRSLEQDKISPIRITWIGADGTVRYDNEAAPAQMENHAARTEVADALRYGAGESERYSATLMDAVPDFTKLAEAYGWRGERVEDPGQVEGAIARMLASEEPYLLDMAISRDQDVYPMVAPGAALDDPIGAIDVAVGAVRSDVRKEDGR